MQNSEVLFYKKNGYFLYKGFFDPAKAEEIRKESQMIFIHQMINNGIINRHDISEDEFEIGIVKLFNDNFEIYANCGKQCQHLINLHRLSLDKKLIQKLTEFGLQKPVVSTRPVLYFNKAKLAKSEEFYKVPPHQDWRSMQGSINSMVVWLPLCNIPENLGALTVIPGSHKFGLLDSTENAWFRQIAKQDLSDFISVEVEPGDALFFSSFLVHSSGNNVLDKIRWSCHFRYNDLEEEAFIERGYPHPYIYKPVQELLTPDFPVLNRVQKLFNEE